MSSSQQSDLERYRRLLRHVVPYRTFFLIAILGMVVYASTDTAFAALMKPLLDGSFVDRNPETIRTVPWLLIGIFILRGLSGFGLSYCMARVARGVIHDLREQMFDRILQLPSRFYDHISSGRLISRFTFDVEQVAAATTQALTILIRDSLSIIGLLLWMLWINWVLTLVFLLVTPLIAILIRTVNKRFKHISQSIQDSMGGVTEVTEETIGGIRIVKLFGAQKQVRRAFARVNRANRNGHLKMSATSAMSVPVTQLLAVLALASIITISTQGNMAEHISAGSFMSFMVAMIMLLAPMKRLTTVHATLQRGITASGSIFALLDQPIEPQHGHYSPSQPCQGSISLRGVGHCYDPDTGSVLDGINLEIRAGETIALVGRSGSGKSTLVSLLPRFYDASMGHILLDGQDIRHFDIEALRQQFSWVGQEVLLFNDSLLENIRFGQQNKSRDDIEQASRAAHAWEFIEQLPHGLDTVIGEKGVLLSGGQRQRIAIARALLRDAPILILDEATSALDSASEQIFQNSLKRLSQNRTTLIIAHRLSTIEHADRIVVLDHGQIVEIGSHADLLAKQGAYHALYQLQQHQA